MKIRVTPYVRERIHREEGQLRLETFRAGGKGGQHQNKTESGVRIVDTVTGIGVACREHRNQLANRKAAMARLVDKLVAHYEAEERALRSDPAPLQEVRVYRQIDGRVRDHRLPGRTYDYDRVLDGKGLETIIRDLRAAELGSQL